MVEEYSDACGNCKGEGSAFTILVGKYEGRRTHGRLWHRWVDDMKMDVKEMEEEVVDWINLA